MEIDDIRDAISEAKLSGDVVQVDKDRIKLTSRGHARAENLIAEKMLPALVAIKARANAEKGIEELVPDMASKLIEKFPLTLQQKARQNFSPLWEEMNEVDSSHYLQIWHDTHEGAQDATA